jgi:hypothetical protein
MKFASSIDLDLSPTEMRRCGSQAANTRPVAIPPQVNFVVMRMAKVAGSPQANNKNNLASL